MKSATEVHTETAVYKDVHDIEEVYDNGIKYYEFGYIARALGRIEQAERRRVAVRADTIINIEYAVMETAKGRADRTE